MNLTCTLLLGASKAPPSFTHLLSSDLGPGSANPKPEGPERERVGGDDEDETEPETIPDGPKTPGPGTGPQPLGPDANRMGEQSWKM